MRFQSILRFVWIFVCFLASCTANREIIAPSPVPEVEKPEVNRPRQDLVVLLPDPDGKVGAIRVDNAGGSQILDKPWHGTQVEDFNKPPMAPQPISENEITSLFGEALSSQPELARRFVSFTLWFESDKTKLTHESKGKLPEIVRTMKSRKAKEIHITGHTDRVGTEEHNRKLSARRANYVRDLFVASGIKSRTFVVSFCGEAMPLVSTEDGVPEPLNRRVEVIVR